jgi:hypothetical protein
MISTSTTAVASDVRISSRRGSVSEPLLAYSFIFDLLGAATASIIHLLLYSVADDLVRNSHVFPGIRSVSAVGSLRSSESRARMQSWLDEG